MRKLRETLGDKFIADLSKLIAKYHKKGLSVGEIIGYLETTKLSTYGITSRRMDIIKVLKEME